MNKLDEKILHAINTKNIMEIADVLQTISFKIGKGIGTLSEISCPLYVAVLRQYANALADDMDEHECEFAEELLKRLNANSTYIKIQVPNSKEE